MFNALLTKPTKKIGFNNLIVKILEEVKNLFFVYYKEIVSFTYSGASSPSFLTNRIRFPSSVDAGSALTTNKYNIGKYTKLIIYWDGIIGSGGLAEFSVRTNAGATIVVSQRTASFTTTIRESIDLTQSTLKNHAEFPNFRFGIYFTGDTALNSSSGNVYEFYLE